MIITTCGHGYTGASAVYDYIRQYDLVQSLEDNFEFQLLHQADGILALKYYLVESRDRIACNSAIKRFIRLQKTGCFACRVRKRIGDEYDKITDEYINNLIQVAWKGRSNYDPQDVSSIKNVILYGCQRKLERIFQRISPNIHIPAYKTRFFSIMSSEVFDDITGKYINALLRALGLQTNRDILLDMLFAATNPEHGIEFFDDARVIIVDRDPRDIYLVAQRSDEQYSFMPWDSCEHFVEYYRLLRENSRNSSKVLKLRYEDLIYDYDTATKCIRDYLGYIEKPQNEYKFFDPSVSIKYTNLKKNTHGYEREIQYIEEHLKEFLYPFESERI